MDAEFDPVLTTLAADLRAGTIDPAALFWLKTYVDLALQKEGDVRSDHWVEAGLAAGKNIPGLDATAMPPRRDLVSRYDLFCFQRLQDGAEFSGETLTGLDWARRYLVRLNDPLVSDLPKLHAKVAALWDELGGVRQTYASLEKMLAVYGRRGRTILL
jgi:hypothetical protein